MKEIVLKNMKIDVFGLSFKERLKIAICTLVGPGYLFRVSGGENTVWVAGPTLPRGYFGKGA